MDRYKIEEPNTGNNVSTVTTTGANLSFALPYSVSRVEQERNTRCLFEIPEASDWPDWAKAVQCTSHFLLTLYSSVTFLIYYAKQRSFKCQS